MGGYRIATIRGIPIRIHFTFLFALPLLAYVFARAFVDAARIANVPAGAVAGSRWLWGLGMALALFGSVLLHELAHSLYAQRKGAQIRSITLLMIGGVSQMAETPRSATHEAIMALVGPLASFAVGGLCFLLQLPLAGTAFSVQFGLFYLGSLNVVIGAFNLIPAFPMDGGRILRAVLARRLGFLRATHVAARVGQVFAVIFGIWGLVTLNLILLFVAFFVFVGAEGETRTVVANALLGRLRVRDLMSAPAAPIPCDATVDQAARRMVAERRLALATTADGRCRGLVTLAAIRTVSPDRRARVLVGDVAVDTPRLAADDDGAKALRLMGESDLPELAVTDDGILVGTIGRDDIVRALKLSELETSRRPARESRRPLDVPS